MVAGTATEDNGTPDGIGTEEGAFIPGGGATKDGAAATTAMPGGGRGADNPGGGGGGARTVAALMPGGAAMPGAVGNKEKNTSQSFVTKIHEHLQSMRQTRKNAQTYAECTHVAPV